MESSLTTELQSHSTMEGSINRVLSLIGLMKNDRKVYVDLVQHGNSSALEIAKRTSIHRTNVYDALRELERKGLILKVVHENKQLFCARSPDKITDYISEIKREVEALVPQLMNIKREEKREEAITLSKGSFAIRDALTELLNLNAPISVYGASKEAVESFGAAFLQEFHKKRVSKKIPMRHIYHQDSASRMSQLNKMKYTEAKYLPKKYDSVVSTAICGDTVLLIIFTKPVSIIHIKNKNIAESYDKYFEILWSKSSTI